MGRSHAKHNTTLSTPTYYERSILKKDAQSQRIGVGSMKPLDSCNLCLSKVSNPVACGQGHLYCRECAISNLITQKAGIDGQKREMERYEANEAMERESARQRARERVLADFEKNQRLGSVAAGRKIVDPKSDGERTDRFEFNKGDMERAASEAEEKALRTIEAEQKEARKSKLAAFWLPNLAPEHRTGPLKNVKLQTLCQVGGEGHPFSRKSLLPVILTYPTPTSATPSCPSCTKELTNSTSAFLLTSRTPAPSSTSTFTKDITNGDKEPEEEDGGRKRKKAKKDKDSDLPLICGHVVCKTCLDSIVVPTGRCCICEASVDESGRIPLGKEGTGYAAAGGAEVKKQVTSFRI